MDYIFSTITNTAMDLQAVLLCSISSLVMGFIIAKLYMYKNDYSKGFTATLTLLPFLVQVVIMLVNGNLGTSVAILGAFGLIRFRSVAGTARDISNIFLAMALGLANGMGYLTFGIFVLIIVLIMNVLIFGTSFGDNPTKQRELRITIPENINFETLFDDLLHDYTKSFELIRVKTLSMGTLFELRYLIEIDSLQGTKPLIDAIRIRNGNLNVACNLVSKEREEL